MGKQRKQWLTLFLGGSKITADGDCSHEIKKRLLLGRKAMTNLDSMLKSRGIILLTKVCIVKAMVFPVVKYGCESWTIKKAECQRIGWQGYQTSQSWIFIGRTDAETDAPILWPPDAKSQLIGKDSDAGKHWRQMEKRVVEDEMVSYHQLYGHEFEQTLGDSEG